MNRLPQGIWRREVSKREKIGPVLWHIPIIPVAQETEAESQVRGQHRQFREPLSQNK